MVSSVDNNSVQDNEEVLELEAVIGFAGNVNGGMILHPDDQRLIYPLGSTIVIKQILENTQRFLQRGGHDSSVSCLTLDREGKLLATGQVTHMGFEAAVLVWDLETGDVKHRLKLHKGKVQSLDFSPNGKYLASLGGEDDNKIVVWNLESGGDPICGATAASDSANVIRYLNQNDNRLVSGGKYNLRVWDFDLETRKLRPTDVKLGQLKRVVTSIAIQADDKFMYAGTLSGDILKIAIESNLFMQAGPKKRPFKRGVRSVVLTKGNELVVGGGDGSVALVNPDTLKVRRLLKLDSGMVTSLSLNAAGDHFFVGTSISCTYLVALDNFDFEIRSSSHFGRINDVAFPSGYSDLFVTASVNDIRVWHARNQNELLRIEVPNLECLCVGLTRDGSAIISGWTDGRIRAFLPESGRLMFTINDAHNSVTAVVASSDGTKLVSGGVDGRVRVWAIKADSQTMIGSLAEHKGKITSIALNGDDTMFVTAGADGSCVLWDMKKLVRLNALFASNQFTRVLLHPDESQILTTGTDRKITYWDAVEVDKIRELQGSDTSAVNALALGPLGEWFVTGGGDKLVRLWHYDDGVQRKLGIGHSGSITKALISPDRRNIVSVGDEGAIMIWAFPDVDSAAPESGSKPGPSE